MDSDAKNKFYVESFYINYSFWAMSLVEKLGQLRLLDEKYSKNKCHQIF